MVPLSGFHYFTNVEALFLLMNVYGSLDWIILYSTKQDFITNSKHMYRITEPNHHFFGPSSKYVHHMKNRFCWAMMVLWNTRTTDPLTDNIIAQKNTLLNHTIVKISKVANRIKVIYLASLKMTVFFTKRLST